MSNATDTLIVKISKLGTITGENLLEQFMDRYDLTNLASATVEQLQEFWDYCTQP